MKIRKSIGKRFRFTASGKVKRRSAFRSHILTKKNTARKRRLRTSAVLGRTDTSRIKKILPKSYM